jgi:hypothetical protein
MILSRFGGDTGGFKSPSMSAKQDNVLFLRQVYNFVPINEGIVAVMGFRIAF